MIKGRPDAYLIRVLHRVGNRKDFKDLINLKSFLFIARLNSNQFVGTQRVCDDSVRCVVDKKLFVI